MELKYKVGQLVYFLHDNKVKYKKIKEIRLTEDGIFYILGAYTFAEKRIFSKREHVYKFFSQQELEELK